MKKKMTRNYRCYKGVLHTFGEGGSTIFHKRIYFRYFISKDGKERAKEILTGHEFPTGIGILLGVYHDTENFVSGSTEVYDYEIDKYLNSILSDKRIFDKEVQEILLPKSVAMEENKPKKRIKM